MLTVVNVQADNAGPFVAAVAACLGARYRDDVPWPERQAMLYRGEAQLGYLCGLPYVVRPEGLEPVAAPVMAGERYAGRPVYFSDVVVQADSPYRTLADLGGRRWAYNEPGSHSGYGLTRYELARRGFPAPFFGEVMEAGAHQVALAWVKAGQADAAAIDSTVLELEDRAGLRVLEAWGPSPIPPFVVSTVLPPAQREQIGQALAALHETPEGRAALALGGVTRFVRATDADYEPIRRMAAVADSYLL
jgi:phosphonate transport system substrate-binding protein